MEFLIKISQFLLSLSLLIVLHELGHFIPAKLFKTRVEKFYLFFDVKFSLFKKKIGDTVYGIGWLPLGGYVKISGMIDESMDKEQMALPPQPWEFRSKPAWQRLIIMLGGVTVNFILAALIYMVMAFAYGETDIATSSITDGYLVTNPILENMGAKTGDNVIAINGEAVTGYSNMRSKLIEAKTITIERNGEQKTLTTPEDFLGQLSTSDDRTFFELRMPFVVAQVPDSSANKGVDLKQGDIITAVNNTKLKYFDEFEPILEASKGKTVNVEVLRDKETFTRSLKVSEDGKFGIAYYPTASAETLKALGYYDIVTKTYGFGESIGVGALEFKNQIVGYWAQLGMIFNPNTGAYKGVGGFKAIFDIFPSSWSWQQFWGITAFLSVMLGVLNLLPIPALDGGHVMFLLYEMISGRKPSDKFLEYAQMVGFFLLIALVLFANGNDIFKALFK
ncbi:RIP metalloprotease RseP [Formosa algae]|uniref:Zinc metalloprotease n=1 Tax=Formosa algae TaxID=225843 RepID=A0A9X1C9K8_9FLAO|nr:RIP metalloprotease RseP [Formosa algae]MBP1840468.1 regulator of sigma E protease [Formosa algae]MDQ0336960.1 regulator of sigma E protease [Formosa algae]OEI80845.1 RIP metalloprotease RseP [Formosa algae]PNW28175.1 RIP metalloprotease RseP [Formosa algae]